MDSNKSNSFFSASSLKGFQFKPLALAITLAVGAGISSTQAATFIVTNTDDSGTGSLRQAVLDADNVADEIIFAPALIGSTISLTGGELSNSIGSLTISGPTAGDASSITIDAGGNSRIIYSNEELTLENLTLTGGVSSRNGGAVYVYQGGLTINDSTITANSSLSNGGAVNVYQGGLTINDSTITANSSSSEGAGIYLYGNLTMNRSTVSNNTLISSGNSGGGLYVSGNSIITDSTISGNSVIGPGNSGGGFFSGGDAIITNSTISGNTASGGENYGGGLYISGSLTLIQSTVTGNSTTGPDTAPNISEGGGIFAYDDTTIIQSTITGNSNAATGSRGAGIVTRYNLTLTNTILAGNTGPEGNAYVGGLLNATNSLFGDDVAEITSNTANVLSDTPLLGPLQDNGGPTATMLLLEGSLALDVGDNGSEPFATDQRGAGFTRIMNGTVDIGAVEGLGAASNSEPIPIFSLTGLLAMLSGFLAIGWRQRFY